ncbi:fasciclin domain-containing protein [Flavobacterium luteum]|uniref:Fasciclin domain-containing protein n=1 Tax=Flavobacterium luteum TaxID=2026654 RepID=A0A7J5AD97_9FLAO|nr:fasciclin domain-containing protein [Flavobacterium luteum]KAB1155534.1 fasciclin domain-containing protein [Flavobacterium luteum]
MKNLFRIKKLALIAIVAILSISCNDDDNPTQVAVDNTITGKAIATPSLSTLVQALTKAKLAGTLQGEGPFTVFAPTNAAFEKYLDDNDIASLDAIPTDKLKQILLNHVVSGKILSTQLETGYVKTLATYGTTTSNISMYINTASGAKLFNGVANVVTPNVEASNGVVHIVDAVIDVPTIVTHAVANASTFSTLVSVVTNPAQSDILTALSSPGALTVFAPTNGGFGKLDTDLKNLGITAGIGGVSQATITDVLKYHVVSGNNLAASLTNGNLTTLLGQTFEVQLTGGAKIKDNNNRISNIIVTDVQCSNGVIHAIDNALLQTLPN